MKIYLLLTTLFFVSSSYAEIKIGNQWTLKQRLGETSVYLKNELTLSTLDGQVPEKRNLTAANYKTEIAKSIAVRKQTLDRIGYKNWMSFEPVFTEINGKKIVHFSGTYQMDNIDYEFTEWQVYNDLKYQTLQLENKVGLQVSADDKKYLENIVKDLQ